MNDIAKCWEKNFNLIQFQKKIVYKKAREKKFKHFGKKKLSGPLLVGHPLLSATYKSPEIATHTYCNLDLFLAVTSIKRTRSLFLDFPTG